MAIKYQGSVFLFVSMVLAAIPTMNGQSILNSSIYFRHSDSLLHARKKEEAITFLSNAQNQLKQEGRQEGIEYIEVLYATGACYSKQDLYQKALPFYQSATDLNQQTAVLNATDQIVLWDGLAACLAEIEPLKSLPIHEKTLAFRKSVSGEISHSAAKGYYNLSTDYYHLGNYDKATEYRLKAIRTLKDAGLMQHKDYGAYLQSLALLYHEEGKLQLASAYYMQALSLMRASEGESGETATCLNTIGELYAKMGDATQAIKYELEAAAIFEKVYPGYLPYCYATIADAYNLDRQPLKAIEYIRRIESYNRKPGAIPKADIDVYVEYCDAYKLLGDYAHAITYIDSAIIALKKKQKYEKHLRLALLNKASVLTLQFQHDEDAGKMAAVDTLLLNAQKIISGILANFNSERNKLAVYRHSIDGIGQTIETYHQFFKITGDPKWLKKSFEFAEIGKGILLYQQVVENKNRRKSVVPADLVDREQSIHAQIVETDKLLFEKGEQIQPFEKDKLREQVFQLKTQYESLRKAIQAVCPDYFLEAAGFPVAQFGTLQKGLSGNEGLLEFYAGDSIILVFLVRQDTFLVWKVDGKKAVEKNILQLRESITRYFLDPQPNSDMYLQAANDYAASAHYLYQTLLAPFGRLLPERLTIVPDGVLAYLPFEALLVEKPKKIHQFHLHHYVAKDYTIRYASSATLLDEMEQQAPPPPGTDKLLAMAPFFDESTPWKDSLQQLRTDPNRFESGPLPYSGEEVFKIATLTDGKAFSGTEASKKTFTQEAPKFRVLHLATHAQANDLAGDYSFLVFAPSADHPEGERMYVSELYRLKLNAELVTLSACETGLGQLFRGEGIVSIARAFASAGAHSIVQSQWAVNDAQTRSLMELFYENLKEGQDKDIAIQKARQEYLRKFPGEHAHPYFWAGFVLIGDRKPVSFFKK
jgi:CHAT domain-containing protein